MIYIEISFNENIMFAMPLLSLSNQSETSDL